MTAAIDTRTATTLAAGQTRAGELRRGAVMILFAAAAVGAVHPFGPLPYYSLPAMAGAALVGSAFIGGQGSRWMGPGLPVLFWGVAKILTNIFSFTGDYALVTGMIGLGAIAAWALSSHGWPSNSFAVGGGIVFIALGQFVHGTYGEWATFFVALVLALTAAVELLSLRTDRRGTTGLETTAANEGREAAVTGRHVPSPPRESVGV
ncbi:MAG: hypothetical protein ACRDY0_08895 [Acidimicrobiales bacterium]